ncbi:histamine H2 receptor-like [Stylophora pistillata]|uniref:histamine H2 receptor-like n=1 Tax=Stylophora pistillata TaxID=50429 RepID=UPI000C042365|nr:histamine H2 receptor-like [Stylophora pistillata]
MNGTGTLEINTTNEAPSTLKHRELPDFILNIYLTRGILAIPLALITSFSNGLVMFLYLKDPKRCLRSSPSCVLVASLALVDFMVGGVLEPIDAYYSLAIAFRKQHSIRRKDLQSAAAYLLLSSMLLLLLITFDRYTAISRPIHYPHRITKKRVGISVVIVWIYCALLIFGIRRSSCKARISASRERRHLQQPREQKKQIGFQFKFCSTEGILIQNRDR